MPVANVPADQILNERTSYDQYLWLLIDGYYYRWDDRIEYMYTIKAVPVDGQGLPPKPPVVPIDSPFTNGEQDYLDENFVKESNFDTELLQRIGSDGPVRFAFDQRYPVVAQGTNLLPDAIRTAMANKFIDPASIEGSALGVAVPPIVVSELAKNDTVKNAAAAAVTENIAGRDLILGSDSRIPQSLPPTDLAFSMVDNQGLRSWVEITKTGHPSANSIKILKSELGLDVQSGIVPATGTATAFTIVDQDGRRSELEVGTDGRLTQRIIDSISRRLPLTSPLDPVKPITTATYDLIVGQEYRLEYKKFILALSADHRVKISGPPVKWGDYGTYWGYTPTSAGTWVMTITLSDRFDNVISVTNIPVTVRAAQSGAGLRHAQIGDSITDMYKYVQGAVAMFPGATAVGPSVRDVGAAQIGVEGHSGWSLDTYFLNWATGGTGTTDTADSPFLFPTDITDGAKFRGNTDWWKRIVTGFNGYHTNGFQKLARGWSDTGPFLYDNNGYPTNATEGDVICDPSKAAGSKFLIYTSGAWATWSVQPTISAGNVEFSFKKYLQRFAIAYPNGLPNSIGIFLGTNGPSAFDLRYNESVWTQWVARMDAFIASIRAWSATVPITIETVIGHGPANLVGNYPESKTDGDRNKRELARRQIAAYDTPQALANKVYVVSQLGVVPEANIYDTVHPDPTTGHPFMAPWLGGKLGKYLSEGLIS